MVKNEQAKKTTEIFNLHDGGNVSRRSVWTDEKESSFKILNGKDYPPLQELTSLLLYLSCMY